MSTPTSSSSSGVRKRVIALSRSAEDLKLRLASVDGSSNGHYGVGLVSPLTELLSSSPSQLQPLTPDLHGRQSVSHSTAWSLSANLLSTSSKNGNSHNASTSNSNHGKAKAPPALDIMSPTTTNRQSVSGNGRGSLPDLTTRKEALTSNNSDVSAERCALSPSSAGGGRSLAFTPTTETLNNTSSVTPQRTSASTLGDLTATPPPNAPRSYSKRTGNGARDSMPPPRPSLGSVLRTGAVVGNNLESPTRRSAEDSNPQLQVPQPRQNGEAMTFVRSGEMSAEHDASHAGPTLADGSSGPTSHCVGPRHTSRVQSINNISSTVGSPSAPSTPAVGSHGRSAQAGSILATSSQRDGTYTAAVTTAPSAGHASTGATAVLASTIGDSNRSHEARGKSSRAPRLTSHLFLDNAATPESVVPTSGLQSPAVAEAKKRGNRSSSSRGRTHTSRGSSEGRVSVSTEISNVGVSPIVCTSRPNAFNFARGELIGKGSFGAVYRGMQRSTNRIICMKEIRLPGIVEELQKMEQQGSMVAEDASPRGAASASTPPPQPISSASADSANANGSSNVSIGAREKTVLLKQMESVKRELHLLKQLNHPNIVKYLNDEIVDGCLRIYMEYVSGGSVASAVKTYGSFEEPQAAALCYQLLQGLSYLHSRGIVHRDLKGDNLLLETSSELKIADFGTAKSIIASATMTANIVGTAYFMAPEVLRPDGVAGTPADVWSTGCCVIEMLTGKPPLSDIPNQYSVMMTIAGSPKVPLEKYIPADNTWSKEVLDFIQQCLRVNPALRPTVQELLQHPWITKNCDTAELRGTTSCVTTATTSSTTPSIPPMDRLMQQTSLNARMPTSPDAVVTATPDFASTHTPTVSPQPLSRCNSGATPRERKSKKEKRSKGERESNANSSSNNATRRQHSRDPTNENVHEESHATPSPLPTGGHRISGDDPSVPVSLNLNGQGGNGSISHPAQLKPGVELNGNSTSKMHTNRAHSNLSLRDDDRQQSFSYDYPLPSLGRLVELMGQSAGNFLPAIPGASSNNSSGATTGFSIGGGGVASSIDGMRGTRFARHFNVSSSRDDTRAHHFPNEDDFMSREPTRLARDFYLDGHDCGRYSMDNVVRYGSTARIPLFDSGLESGLYSTLDCLTAPPTAEDLAPFASSRRSTSKRAGRGGPPAN